MHKIKDIRAREILDSRGNPTIEVDLWLTEGFGRASVPSGASTGKNEALELRDRDKRYHGRGVLKAVKNVNEKISKTIIGKILDQRSLDGTLIKLDGTKEKKNLGANAILGVSMAFAKAAAMEQKIPLHEYFRQISDINRRPSLPVPLVNILNGGKHAIRPTDLQEFMIVPIGAPSFKEAVRWSSEVFHTLGKLLASKGISTTVGDEGGYAPSLKSNEDALKILVEAIEKSGYKPGKDISLAIDAAASEFYENGKYKLRSEGKVITSDQLIQLYEKWIDKYPIVSIEDGLSEDDRKGHVDMTKRLGKKVQLVGDDLFVTNVDFLRKGIQMGAGNSILIKLNQIGTVTETIDAVSLALGSNYSAIISHRSGETEDTTIADLSVGLGVGQIKTGSVSRGERTAKYNQLLRIEEELGNKASYVGRKAFK